MAVWRWKEGVYDRLEAVWSSPRVNRGFASFLIVAFLGTLVLVELGRVGLVPLLDLPRNHFAAICLG